MTMFLHFWLDLARYCESCTMILNLIILGDDRETNSSRFCPQMKNTALLFCDVFVMFCDFRGEFYDQGDNVKKTYY
jgi:hypothetical protein